MGTTAIIFLVLMIVVTGFTAAVLIAVLASNRKQPLSEPTVEQGTTSTDVTSQTAATQAQQAPEKVAPTHEEKYEALPEKERSLYDEIAAYAAAVEGAESKLNDKCEQYAIGSKKIVRLSIKNDVVVCSFALRNVNVFAHKGNNRIMISTASITTKVTDREHVVAAKNTIDTVVRSINEEKQLKSRIASEQRKQKVAKAQ